MPIPASPSPAASFSATPEVQMRVVFFSPKLWNCLRNVTLSLPISKLYITAGFALAMRLTSELKSGVFQGKYSSPRMEPPRFSTSARTTFDVSLGQM